MLLKIKVIKDDGAPGWNFAPGFNFHRRGPGVSGPRPIPTRHIMYVIRHYLNVYVRSPTILENLRALFQQNSHIMINCWKKNFVRNRRGLIHVMLCSYFVGLRMPSKIAFMQSRRRSRVRVALALDTNYLFITACPKSLNLVCLNDNSIRVYHR